MKIINGTILVAAVCALALCAVSEPALADDSQADVVVYGSSPAAVTAAVKAKGMGLEAVIVSPELHIGGLSVSGLGFTDSGNTAAIGGLAREFYRRIYREYMKPETWRWQRMEDFKADGQDTKAICHEDKTMWTFEPHVAERVFAEWLAEKGIVVRRGEFLDRERGVEKKDGRIVSVRTLSGNVYRGRYFIDATYEGDLMAAAGVPYRVGREDCSEFGEKWNGNQVGVLHHKHHFRNWKISAYKRPGDPSSGLCAGVDASEPGVRGKGDRRVQAYCYRLCMTDDPRNRIPFSKPDGYDPVRYELLSRVYAKGYGETFEKFDRIANHKTDTNNHGPVNFDLLGGSYEWPEASYARRAELAKIHRDYQMGLCYFIANDPSVPAAVRGKMSKWGLAKDEFVDNGGWPYYVYVREGRRMAGAYVMTEHDCLGEPRHPAQGRAYGPVGMGSYVLDSHNVRRYVTPEGYVQNEGDIGVHPKRPYGIDYGSIVPRREDCQNLLVPVALSATHMAFGSIRMEPVFMVLGESAATAASIAAKDARAVQDVAYSDLAARLKADGQVLCLEKKVSTSHKTGQKVYLEDMAGKPAEKTSSLPEVLLIGDSMREGYCKHVAESLRGRAEVKWPSDNCRNSQYVLTSLAMWRGLVASPKVVHFNCGHWDAAHWDGDDDALTTVEEYGRNIRKIIRRIRRYWPDAKIIFATTTPMSPSGKQSRNPRTTESIIRYNAEAERVAKSEGVEVNDLFAVLEKWPASDYKDYAHLTEAAAKRLGEIIARRLIEVGGL